MAFRIGVLAVIGGILISIAIGMYAYDQYKTVPVYATAGELLQIGPVSYAIEYDGLHDGNDVTSPENVFYQIAIRAKNTGSETVRISNSQFSITGPGFPRASPVFSNFSATDLSGMELEPGEEAFATTQFDIPHELGDRYVVQIRPTKEHSAAQIGLVCLSEC